MMLLPCTRNAVIFVLQFLRVSAAVRRAAALYADASWLLAEARTPDSMAVGPIQLELH